MLDQLVSDLRSHGNNFPLEKKFCNRTIWLIEEFGEVAFQNQNWAGHITASCLVMNPERTKLLLMMHKKLQKWLQFGGHSDGASDTLGTAIREFHEESGIDIEPDMIPGIFSVDIHDIPADLKWRPPHQHYDILYLATIPEDTPFVRQESEVDDIRWFDILWIEKYVGETRMLNMIERIQELP